MNLPKSCANQPSPPRDVSLGEAVSVFVELQRRLFGIAYRVLGSATEAEDVLQEVWLRWQKTDRSAVVNPAAFLSCATTRLAINVAQSARVRRQNCIGPWLPEPIDTSSDPEAGVQQAEELDLALLLVLERLTPVERAVYILREAFEYTYADIADVLRLSAVNARKIASRARRHLLAERREVVDAVQHRRLREAFVTAARTGNVASLETFLAPDTIGRSFGRGTRGSALDSAPGSTHAAHARASSGGPHRGTRDRPSRASAHRRGPATAGVTAGG
ncbi:sigma-70 family RNA polymerase sigma factor [Streptomyces sp. NPDC032161]|uniref:sigma-70 family RNA polymerase sigma factor n=1 Tax=unclassified Streptomyces TaxID=2593676 RepID=UPI0033DAA0E7